ncbi:flagellar basal body protein FliL [Desulfomarina profundi]|uniref:Flagellar protein FliL n=1 Tax=Desulfomarina profundi TaxID=2772557 RepID=A0A8D5FHA1_9BACT|nr:flagellar basal body-associated FliL family protein [Desulfomarina profundi]BCL60601.1 flagellar basal body protein FliL [Desulfomarina profundi]
MAEKKEEEKAEGAGGGKKKLFIIIGAVVLVLLIGGGVAAYFMLKKEPQVEPKDPGLEVPVPELTKSAEIGPMVDIEEFIVNIISEDANHYVKASLTVELTNEEVKEEVTKRMPQIRDAILLLLGNKTYEELQDLQGKRQLKAELLSKLNSFLQTGKVKSIYFTNFVVQ